jgi:outer membrane protein assembly factor BamB
MTQAPFEVIDLGVLDGSGDERRLTGVRLPRRWRQLFLAAAVAVVCVLTMAGSAIRMAGLGDPLWTGKVSLNGVSIGADTVYTVRPDGRAVLALDIRSGKQRWQLPITDLPDGVVEVGSGVAVVRTHVLDPTANNDGWPTFMATFVRIATGEVLNRVEGSVDGPSAPGLPVLIYSRSGHDCENRPERECLDIAGYDVATGRERWRLAGGHGSLFWATSNHQVAALASLTWGDGVDHEPGPAAPAGITLYDIGTGRKTNEISLPLVDPDTDELTLNNGVFLVLRQDGDRATVVGYTGPSYQQAWSFTVPAPPFDPQVPSRPWVEDCGPDVCLHLGEQRGRVVNVHTGAVSDEIGLNLVGRIGDGVLLATSAYEGAPGKPVIGYVLDPSGHPITQLNVQTQVVWRDDRGRGLVTVEGKDRTGFFVVNEAGRIQNLGSVFGTMLACDAYGDYLACGDPTGKLRVWRLPRAVAPAPA